MNAVKPNNGVETLLKCVLNIVENNMKKCP